MEALSSFTAIISAAGSGAKCAFPWMLCVVIFRIERITITRFTANLQPQVSIDLYFKNHCALPVLTLCQQRFESKGSAAANQNMEPLKRMSPPDTDTEAWECGAIARITALKTHRGEQRAFISRNASLLDGFCVNVGSRTCSIVRLQARIRVQSAHHEVVGEAARSRSGGRSAAAHPRCGAVRGSVSAGTVHCCAPTGMVIARAL